MDDVETLPYDLTFDPNDVGPDLVVECWISQGPRAGDTAFDPQPGDEVTAGDDEGAPLHGRVIRREANRVWVQLDLTRTAHAAL
jgi:hypothetical protein